jgi:hypothetical protein
MRLILRRFAISADVTARDLPVLLVVRWTQKIGKAESRQSVLILNYYCSKTFFPVGGHGVGAAQFGGDAIEAAVTRAEKVVAVSVISGPETLAIRVRNSGLWIDDDMGDQIYRRGVTTKGDGRGYGLALVAEKVAMNGAGSIS